MDSGIPAVTASQMAEIDRLMIEEYGIELIQMMENAGRSLAALAIHMQGAGRESEPILVLCGTGNNGGGGMVAALHLHNWGCPVRVHLVTDPARLKEVPGKQWRILRALNLGENSTPNMDTSALIIDALLGYGLRGDPHPPIAEWIERANASGRPILALDIPSGLEATSGMPNNPCIRAAATLTLALPKTGLLAETAQPSVGRLYLADIGVPPELYRHLELAVPPLFKGIAPLPLV